MKKYNTLLIILICFILISQSLYAQEDILLNVYKYRQCESLWGNQQIGYCSNTMCNLGCAVTCTAMLLKSHGANADPGTLNTWLKNNNGYVQECVIDWDRACDFPGSTMSYIGWQSFSLVTIKNKIDQNDPVVVEVDLPSSNLQHFVVVRGYTGNGVTKSDFRVYDPLEVNERNLSQYNEVALRVFNNVIQSGLVSVSFKFNGTELPGPPNEYWKLWKYPPLTSNFYTLTVAVTGRPSGSAGYWDLFVYRPNGDSTDAALNVQTDVLSQGFNVSTSLTWFSTNGLYKFKVMNRTTPPTPRTIWAVSQPFYISSVPSLTVGNMPDLQVGQSATFSWSITGGIPTLPYGGWTGNIQIQWHQGNPSSPLNVLAMRPVESSPYVFIVPSSNGGTIPGVNFRLSGSNPPGSSIPDGRISAFTNYFSISNPTSLTVESEIIPIEYSLQDNYPNPFNPVTNIKFGLPKESSVKLTVYDALGKEVTLLVNQHLEAGSFKADWNASDYPSGIYYYKLEAGEFTETKKMVLIK